MKRNLVPIRDKIRADKRCERLMTLFQELPIYQLPIEDMTKEIEQIHKARGIRFLSQSSPRFIEAIVDASLLDQANRSRLTEISMACYKAHSTLSEALDPLKTYLLLTYASDLQGIRTKEERNQIIYMALVPFFKFTSKVEQVRTLASMVIDDIDKGAYSLQRLIASYQINSKREHTI